jgi:hypothetical protein
MSQEKSKLEAYKELIDKKAKPHEMSNPYFFNTNALEEYSEQFQNAAELSDLFDESVYCEESIYKIWANFVGKEVGVTGALYDEFLDSDYYKKDSTGYFAIQDYFRFIDNCRDTIIDCGGYGECSDIEVCADTGKVLMSFPYSIEEIKESLNDQLLSCQLEESINQEVWNYLYLVTANHPIELLEDFFPLFDKEL